MALSKFVKVYNSLPLAERDMVCVVIDDNGISWKLAYQEIKDNTALGQRIQKQLESLSLI